MKRLPSRRFNVTALSLSLLLLTAMVVGGYGLNRLQRKRTSSVLLHVIDRAIEDKDWLKSSDYIYRYLSIHPDDVACKIKLADVVDRLAITKEDIQGVITLQHIAISACESTPGFAEEIPAIRSKMVDRLMSTARYEDALEQIAKLAGPRLDLELERKLALCRFRLFQENRSVNLAANSKTALPRWIAGMLELNVIDLLLKAYVDNPQNMDLGVALASVCLGDQSVLKGSVLAPESRDSLVARAISISDRLIAAHPRDPKAWLAHYEISAQKDNNVSDADLERALELAPDSPYVHKQVGTHYLTRAQSASVVSGNTRKQAWLDRADHCLRRAVELDSTPDPRIYESLGEVLAERGDSEAALEMWKQGCVACKDSITTNLHLNIVRSLLKSQKLDEAEEAHEALLQSIRRDSLAMSKSAVNTATRLAKQFKANLYLARGDYEPAVRAMEDVVFGTKELDQINQSEALAFLGSCFMKIGQTDRAAASYEQALSVLPATPSYHRGAACAWFAAKRYSEALKHLQCIENKTAYDWIQTCEVVLELQRTYVSDQAIWQVFDKGMAEAKRLLPNDPKLAKVQWTIDLFRLDASIQRAPLQERSKQFDNATLELAELCDRYPESIELIRFAIQRFRQWGRADEAERLLQSLKTEAPNDIDAAMSQANLLVQEGLKEYALQILEAKKKDAPEDPRLDIGIQQIRSATKDWDSALEGLSKIRGNKLSSLRRLYEAALDMPVVASETDLQKPDVLKSRIDAWCSRLERIESTLRKVEGEDGTEWRYVRGRRLLAAGSLDANFDVAELSDLAGTLDRNRPQWASAHILSGLLAERQGNLGQAVRDMTRAIKFGAHELAIFEKLTSMMYRQGMLSEAKVILDKLGELSNQSRQLSSLAMELAGDAQRDQLSVANSGVVARPNDPMAWLWLAQVTEVHSRNASPSVREKALAEAEAAFQKADELTEHRDIRVKNARFNYYHAIGDIDRAERIIQELTASPGMDDAIRFLSMAHMHLILEHEEAAIECFTEAVRYGADPVEMGNRVAQLWLNARKPNRAIEELERVLERVPNDAPTRRRLAALLADRGTALDWTRVDELLSATREENTPDDVRLQVLLLSRKGTANDLAKAQYLLELIVDDPSNRTDEDRFQLASLYLRSESLKLKENGESTETRQLADAAGRLLKMACNGPKANPKHIYAYADFLLKQDRYYDALEESDRLNKIEPESFTTKLLEARLQLANGMPAQAKETIMKWMNLQLESLNKENDVSKRSVPMVQAGQALMALKMPKDAESLLREAYRWDPGTAKDYVRNLLATDDLVVRKMAIDFLVERVKNEKTSEFASVLVGVLKASEADPRLATATQEAVAQIDTGKIADPQLLKALADHWIWQGKEVSAIETFRRIIELRPNDIVALNNLANLLAEQPNGTAEALQHIERAIEIAGENPVLLDTKGTVLLLGERYLEAVQVLRLAEAKEPSDPRILLHLFIALKGALNSSDPGSVTDADVEAVANRINLEQLRKYPLTRGDQTEADRLAKSRGK